MSDIAAFLAARYDEDEDLAREAGRDSWVAVDLAFIDDSNGRQIVRDEYMTPGVQAHIARHDPARVLREVAAGRQIIDYRDESARHAERDGDRALGLAADTLDECIRLLALPYADHPDYDPAWSTP